MENNATHTGRLFHFLLLSCIISYVGVNWVWKTTTLLLFYFISLAHRVRGRCWWYGSRGWTFPKTFHYILLLSDRWHHRSSLTKWHLTWKCVRSKDVSLNSTMQKKLYPLTSTDTCFICGDQTVDMSTVRWWVFQQQQQRVTSAGAGFDKHGMQALVYHWWKCIANGGSHVEKYCFVVENLFYQADLLSELQTHFQNSILRSQVQSGLGIIYRNRHLYWKTVICNCYMQ